MRCAFRAEPRARMRAPPARSRPPPPAVPLPAPRALASASPAVQFAGARGGLRALRCGLLGHGGLGPGSHQCGVCGRSPAGGPGPASRCRTEQRHRGPRRRQRPEYRPPGPNRVGGPRRLFVRAPAPSRRTAGFGRPGRAGRTRIRRAYRSVLATNVAVAGAAGAGAGRQTRATALRGPGPGASGRRWQWPDAPSGPAAQGTHADCGLVSRDAGVPCAAPRAERANETQSGRAVARRVRA
jgi:hypothetical protein